MYCVHINMYEHLRRAVTKWLLNKYQTENHIKLLDCYVSYVQYYAYAIRMSQPLEHC